MTPFGSSLGGNHKNLHTQGPLPGGFYFFSCADKRITQPSIPGTMTNETAKSFTHPAAHQLRSHNFRRMAEGRERQSGQILGDALGGYGRGWRDNLLKPSLTTLLAEATMK